MIPNANGVEEGRRPRRAADFPGGGSTSGPRAGLLILGVCTVLGVLEAAKSYYSLGARGQPRSWTWVLFSSLPWWYGWAVVAPVGFRVARRWPLVGSRRPHAIQVHLGAAILLAATHSVVTAAVTHWLTGAQTAMSVTRSISIFLSNYFIVSLVVYAAIVGMYFALDYARRWRESTLAAARLETHAARLEVGLADARLQALRMELNPHFLFNTLNAISGLVRRRENDAAVGMLARLGDLLRTTLDRNLPQEIALDDELALLQRYLDIEQARFGARLVVNVEVDPAARRALVPTLVCQPLVENAVRHGVARRRGTVAVTIDGTREGASLVLRVRDSGKGLGSVPVREGIGLSNTRTRLRELYGEAAALQLDDAAGGGAVATVRLPFREAVRDTEITASA
ncbi:MAG TPA: histidine kinase [Gemmatimonadaceae bacterium]|nr:histidine kinase [Gemmatimonadaceae bacterium]